MLTRQKVERKLKSHPWVKPRLATLALAQKINPKFKNPHIVGGYLRDTILGHKPHDCDVIFEGYQLNQPGTLEAVQKAEERLGIKPYPNWEFENISATGFSGNLHDDAVGKYSFHTDFLTMLIMDPKGKLSIGHEEKTLHDLEKRIYDLNFPGISMWANHRGAGRSYASCITGDLIRGLYLTQSLKLHPSEIVTFLWSHFDTIFSSLNKEDQQARINYWKRKTKGDPSYNSILKRFKITALKY